MASGRYGFGACACAVVFGIGAGLVLDEFALILHLHDVYWTEEGRKSVEVVVVTAALVGLVLSGFAPFGVNDLTEEELQDRGSVIAYALDLKAGTLKPLQTVSTLPQDFKGTNACAEIKVHPGGKALYVSNRGHDSIARFTLDAEGRLTAAGQVPTEKTPRSFDLDPSGQFLFAAGEGSGKVAAYRIDRDSGGLTRLTTQQVGPRPWWVLAVEMPAK